MKVFLCMLAALAVVLSAAQQHDLKPADALKSLAFMKGDWAGTQNFNTQGGPALSGDATNHIDDAIGGRYLCEMLSTTMTGRKPTDTRHFISYDPKTGKYTAWWFTDTSVGPLEFEGDLTDGKLVLLSKPGSPTTFRATYSSPDPTTLTYTLEMQQDGTWTRLFTTTYKRKPAERP
ncbi:MAG TPA: DUF1579 family protein [Fimbriimonadaceae bacterium]|nr:DUF1579 family protein [Fimbriimonadaceae bacterium]